MATDKPATVVRMAILITGPVCHAASPRIKGDCWNAAIAAHGKPASNGAGQWVEREAMSKPIEFFKADGSAASDMSVTIYGQWLRLPLGDPVSWQFAWDGAATGTWSIEGTNRPDPAVTETRVDVYPSAAYMGTPSQPAGVAGSTTIMIKETCNAYHRPKFVPSSGGTGVTPSGDVCGKNW